MKHSRITTIKLRVFILISVLPFGAICDPAAAGKTLRVSGDLEVAPFLAGKYVKTNVRSFEVIVNDCRTRIRVSPSTSDEGVEYFEFGSDGTNSYYTVRNASTLRRDAQEQSQSGRLVNDS